MLQIGRPETPQQFEAYYDLRWRILCAPWGQTRDTGKDDLESTADHVTVQDEQGRLLGVGRLHLNSEEEAQIRYMACDEDCRRLGAGRGIIEKLEAIAREHGVKRIVLNARKPVIGFYEHLDYTVLGPGPTVFGSIEHSKMEKVL